MNITTLTGDFAHKLAVIGRVVNKSAVSLYRAITITATADDIWLYGRDSYTEIWAKLGGRVIEPGRIHLLGEYLLNVVRTYDADAAVTLDRGTLVSGNFENTVAQVPGPDTITFLDTDNVIQTNLFLSAIRETKWAEKHLLLDGRLIGAIGGHWVGISQVDITSTAKLNPTFVDLASSFEGQASVYISPTDITLVVEDFVIRSSLEQLPSTLPNIDILLPSDSDPTFILPDIKAALRNAIATTNGSAIDMLFADDQLQIRAYGNNIGDLEVSFNTPVQGRGNLHVYPNQIYGAIGRFKPGAVVYQHGSMVIFSDDSYMEMIVQVDNRF